MGSKLKISTTADGRTQVRHGRSFDNQGRASWEWQTATGVFEADVTNEQMQGLEAAGLAVLETEPIVSSGRVWTSASRPATQHTDIARRAKSVAPARDQTVLKRLLRRIAG